MIEDNKLSQIIDNSFRFLIDEYSFSGPVKWNCGPEDEFTYFKNQIYLNISYDGDFFASIGKTDKIYPDLISGKIKLDKIDYKYRTSYNIYELYLKSELKAMNLTNNASNHLSFIVQSIKDNPDILDGTWNKFSLRNKIGRRIRKLIINDT